MFSAVLLSNTKSSSVTANSVTYTLQRCLKECLKVAFLSYLITVKFLKKKMCSMNCGWIKETFWQYVAIHELDKHNKMFQNVKRVLHQNKAHTK